MDFAQGRELWNTIALKKNLSIHHGLKIINGWRVVPKIGSPGGLDGYETTMFFRNMREVSRFLKGWAGSLDNEIERLKALEDDDSQ